MKKWDDIKQEKGVPADYKTPLTDTLGLVPHFDGDTYNAERDHDRLAKQLRAVRDLMLDGRWRTLYGLSLQSGYPEASISARLRDLRKSVYGGYTVTRRHIAHGLWEYQVTR